MLHLHKRGLKITVHWTYKYAVMYNENYLFMNNVYETTTNIKKYDIGRSVYHFLQYIYIPTRNTM